MLGNHYHAYFCSFPLPSHINPGRTLHSTPSLLGLLIQHTTQSHQLWSDLSLIPLLIQQTTQSHQSWPDSSLIPTMPVRPSHHVCELLNYMFSSLPLVSYQNRSDNIKKFLQPAADFESWQVKIITLYLLSPELQTLQPRILYKFLTCIKLNLFCGAVKKGCH